MSKAKAKKAPIQHSDETANENVGQDGRAEKRTEKRVRIGEELAQELDGLRETLSEMVEGYRFKVEGQLAELSAAARGASNAAGQPALLRVSAAEKMLGSIKKTELKPKKGRAKDFQRLETLVEELAALLPAPK